MTIETLMHFEQFRSAVYQALKSWARIDSGEEALLGSLLLVQRAREKGAQEDSATSLRQITNSVLEQGLATLASSDERGEALLRARFIEGKTTRQVALALEASVDQVNRWQRQAIDDLARILHTSEKATRSERLVASRRSPGFTGASISSTG